MAAEVQLGYLRRPDYTRFGATWRVVSLMFGGSDIYNGDIRGEQDGPYSAEQDRRRIKHTR